jgi:hypothetical protein
VNYDANRIGELRDGMQMRSTVKKSDNISQKKIGLKNLEKNIN